MRGFCAPRAMIICCNRQGDEFQLLTLGYGDAPRGNLLENSEHSTLKGSRARDITVLVMIIPSNVKFLISHAAGHRNGTPRVAAHNVALDCRKMIKLRLIVMVGHLQLARDLRWNRILLILMNLSAHPVRPRAPQHEGLNDQYGARRAITEFPVGGEATTTTWCDCHRLGENPFANNHIYHKSPPGYCVP